MCIFRSLFWEVCVCMRQTKDVTYSTHGRTIPAAGRCIDNGWNQSRTTWRWNIFEFGWKKEDISIAEMSVFMLKIFGFVPSVDDEKKSFVSMSYVLNFDLINFSKCVQKVICIKYVPLFNKNLFCIALIIVDKKLQLHQLIKEFQLNISYPDQY